MSGDSPPPPGRTLTADQGRAFAERVAAESWRLALEWRPGDEDPPPVPIRIRSLAERDAAYALVDAQEARRIEAAEIARWDAIAADPERRAQLAEVLSSGAFSAPNLDPEGISERSPIPVRFSAQANPRTRAYRVPSARGSLALASQVDVRPALHSAAQGGHEGHGCCKDRLLPFGNMTLVGRQPSEVWDVIEGEDGTSYSRVRQAKAAAIENACKRWRCPCCKWRLRRRNRARAIRGALHPREKTWFLTITLDRSTDAYQAFDASWRERHGGVMEPGGRILTGQLADTMVSIRFAAAAWKRLDIALRREFGRRVEYYKALELHPGDKNSAAPNSYPSNQGTAHLHLLIRTGSISEWFMHYGRWRQMLARAGFGVVTKVEQVKDHGSAARYVTKMTAAYTSKDMAELPRWTRRGAWSRAWCEWEKPTRLQGFTWALARASQDIVAAGLIASGYTLVDPNEYREGSP